MRNYRGRSQRGITMPEVLIAMSISMLALAALVGVVRIGNAAWATSSVEEDAKEAFHLAATRMAPSIRGAMRVEMAQSNSRRLTVVLPREDAVTSGYELPLADGAVVSFYQSDTSGNPVRTGTILWRSVNGTPDAEWSLTNGRGKVVLSATSLAFTYMPATDPRSVRIALATDGAVGARTISRAASTEVFLRNRQR